MGPADADAWRVDNPEGYPKGRYYVDPLPGCDIAPADDPDRVYPSFSRIKNVTGGRDWTYTSYQRIAQLSDNDWQVLASLPPQRRLDSMLSVNKYLMNVAFGRGTIIHWWGEDMLDGHEPREITLLDMAAAKIEPASLAVAERYRESFIRFFETHKPRRVAKEYPVINRDLHGVGFGCTPDGIVYLDNPPPGKSTGPWAFDYKSRTPDGKHGAYEEEKEQITAGLRGHYMGVAGPNGEAVRQEIPEVAGGIVISIKPDSCRVFSFDPSEWVGQWESRHRRFVDLQNKPRNERVWPIWNGGAK